MHANFLLYHSFKKGYSKLAYIYITGGRYASKKERPPQRNPTKILRQCYMPCNLLCSSEFDEYRKCFKVKHGFQKGLKFILSLFGICLEYPLRSVTFSDCNTVGAPFRLIFHIYVVTQQKSCYHCIIL